MTEKLYVGDLMQALAIATVPRVNFNAAIENVSKDPGVVMAMTIVVIILMREIVEHILVGSGQFSGYLLTIVTHSLLFMVCITLLFCYVLVRSI